MTDRRALIPEQEPEIPSGLLGAGIGRTLQFRILCGRCGKTLGGVEDLAFVAGDGTLWNLVDEVGTPFGAVLRAQVLDEGMSTQAARYGRRPPTLGFVAALLERPSAAKLPANLPFWCDRHGTGTVPLKQVMGRLRQARRDDEEAEPLRICFD
jgi:hypothetical protein